MLKKTKSGIGRRQAVKVMGAGAALIAVPEILVPRKARAAERLVVRDPGGPFEKAFKEALHKPFQQATGIEVVGVTGQHEPVAIIKGMVDTKAYQWDVTIVSEYTHNTLAKAGYLEPLGFENDSVIGEIPSNLKQSTIVASYVWSTILAYRTDVYPSKAKAPTGGWKDLWDVKGIPGRRGLRKYPVDTLENAVLADGVAADKVYPIDQDRAFKSLDKIKKDVAVWWDQGAQASQMLKTNEVDILPCWNGRIQAVIDEVFSEYAATHGAGYPLLWRMAQETVFGLARAAALADEEELRASGFVPAAFEIQSITEGDMFACGYAGQNITCTVDAMASGDSTVITVTVKAGLTAATITHTNTAEVSTSTHEDDLDDNSDDADVKVDAAASNPPPIPETGSSDTFRLQIGRAHV